MSSLNNTRAIIIRVKVKKLKFTQILPLLFFFFFFFFLIAVTWSILVLEGWLNYQNSLKN
jgi:hypothetical protein